MAVDELINRWSTTTAQETKTRENAWHELQAHGRAAEHLASLVGRAQQLLESQSQSENQKENEYLNDQGFGYPPMNGAEQPFQ
jgi:hypothetical protein